MYIIKNERVKDIISEIESRLLQIEVRGSSVEHLYAARVILKQVFDMIEESKDEKQKEA